MIIRYVDDFCTNDNFSKGSFSKLKEYRAEVTCFNSDQNFACYLEDPNKAPVFLNKEHNLNWIECRIYDEYNFCFLLYKNEFRKPKRKTKEYLVYVLNLENDKFYIGSTVNLKNRFKQHFEGESTIAFIRENPVMGVHQVLHTYNSDMNFKVLFENFVTYQYLLIYGVSRVHGGDFLNDEKNKAAKMKSYGKTARAKRFMHEFEYIWNNLRCSFDYDYPSNIHY